MKKIITLSQNEIYAVNGAAVSFVRIVKISCAVLVTTILINKILNNSKNQLGEIEFNLFDEGIELPIREIGPWPTKKFELFLTLEKIFAENYRKALPGAVLGEFLVYARGLYKLFIETAKSSGYFGVSALVNWN